MWYLKVKSQMYVDINTEILWSFEECQEKKKRWMTGL